MFKLLIVAFLTLFTVSSYAIDKYDFFVNKGLPCADRKVIEQKLNNDGWIPTIKIEQTSAGWWTYICFKEDENIPGKVKSMKIFEFEPTGNIACLVAEDNGNVWFNKNFWNNFYLGRGENV